MTDLNNPTTFSIYAEAYLDANLVEGSNLEVRRWAVATFPEDFED